MRQRRHHDDGAPGPVTVSASARDRSADQTVQNMRGVRSASPASAEFLQTDSTASSRGTTLMSSIGEQSAVGSGSLITPGRGISLGRNRETHCKSHVKNLELRERGPFSHHRTNQRFGLGVSAKITTPRRRQKRWTIEPKKHSALGGRTYRKERRTTEKKKRNSANVNRHGHLRI